ncbi:MAG: helix-turn-helix domain-containing protein [Cyanobacteria bacterium]|nr:helix-turn-helix domain-containing protein [Cyanobacteriota bacterium]
MEKTVVGIQTYPDGRMDTKNTALYLGLSVKTIAMMRSRGTGPSYIKRGRIFYFLEDLNEWLNAYGRATSTAQVRTSNNKTACN